MLQPQLYTNSQLIPAECRKQTELGRGCAPTPRVPVNVGDVAGVSLAHPHSLTAQHVVDVNEVVM